MAAFDLLVPTAGNDTFSDMYTKYNDTQTALKAGTSLQLLVGSGAGTAPVYTDVWGAFTLVGSGGGAPSFASGFQVSGASIDQLRFRKSLVLDTIELCGQFERITSNFATNATGTLFTLPAGFRPARTVFGYCRNLNGNGIMSFVINTAGQVDVVNVSGSTFRIGDFSNINLRFSIS